MPDVAEPPPVAQPAKKTVIEGAAIPAKSMAEQFAENPKTLSAEGAVKPDFAKLSAAQAKDKGQKAAVEVEEPEPPPAKVPAQPAPKEQPKVPALPPPEEYRPRTEKAAQQWDSLKSKHAEEMTSVRGELDRVKAELTAAKANGSPDVEALKKEAKELREILRDVAIERHPDFKNKFEPREKTAIEAAKLAAGDHGNKLERLLKSPPGQWRDEQIESITAELPKSSQLRIESALRLLDQIDLEKQSEIATQRASFDLKQSTLMNQQKEQAAETQKRMLADFEAVQKQWTDPNAGHPFFIEREGDKEHNAGVKESLELAKTIFSGELSSQEIAAAAFWAASGERLLKGWQSAISRAEKAERALDKLRGVQPGEGKPGSVNGQEADKAPPPGSPEYLRYMNARLREAQQKDSGRG